MTKESSELELTIASYAQSASAYQRDTEGYDQFPGLREEVDTFLGQVRGPILDAGSGAGRDAIHMASQGHEVVAIDLCPPFLEMLPSGISVAQADGRRLPFRAGTFGGIWCCAVLVHLTIEDALTALAEFERVLRHGGLAAISVRIGGSEGTQIRGAVTGPRWFKSWTPDELHAAATTSGLHRLDEWNREIQEGVTWHTLVLRKGASRADQ